MRPGGAPQPPTSTSATSASVVSPLGAGALPIAAPMAPLAPPAPVRQEALPESLLGTSFGMPLVQKDAEEGGKRNSFQQKPKMSMTQAAGDFTLKSLQSNSSQFFPLGRDCVRVICYHPWILYPFSNAPVASDAIDRLE